MTADQPKVAILMSTYNGQHHLSEQLDSFAEQTHLNWAVWVSDDGSKDGTRSILDAYKQKWSTGRLSVCLGPRAGFAANFISLASNFNIKADYYAYSDQDDIWEPDRLSRALEWLERVPHDIPALYSSRTRYVSKDGQELGLSTLFKRPPSFRNALVQNIAGGNTMIFNEAARELVAHTPTKTSIVSHDWWTYLLVSGCGGRVFYDPYPGVRYRQHCSNIAGENTTILAKAQRLKGLLFGQFKNWNQKNLNALNEMSPVLTHESQLALQFFKKARCGPVFSRIYHLHLSGVYRQTLAGNVGLFVGSILRKL